MPRLRSISAARYRSFATPVELELRPLTLLYGRNSSGKSTLLRLLPILADSVDARAGAPLELSGAVGGESGFHDLLWKNPLGGGPHDLTIGLSWIEGRTVDAASFVLRYSEDRKQTLVEELRLLRGERTELVARRSPSSRENDRGGAPLVYDVAASGAASVPRSWAFQGLVPAALPEVPEVDELREVLIGLRDRVQWLQALRTPPRRRNPERGSMPPGLRPDGADACHALRADDTLLQEVSAWYEEHVGRVVELRDAPPHDFRVLLRPRETTSVDVDIVDAGEGFVQVFPVLAALALARRRATEGQFILAAEEPESHLHPDRQVALAQALCAAAAGATPPVTVIETHSFPLMLAIQIQIARGVLPPERVVAYWIEQLDDGSSIASRVTFGPLGHPEGPWPPSVFADQRRLALELQRARSEASAPR
jgi:predicted ATPase